MKHAVNPSSLWLALGQRWWKFCMDKVKNKGDSLFLTLMSMFIHEPCREEREKMVGEFKPRVRGGGRLKGSHWHYTGEKRLKEGWTPSSQTPGEYRTNPFQGNMQHNSKIHLKERCLVYSLFCFRIQTCKSDCFLFANLM